MNENITPLPLLRDNPMSNGVTTQVVTGSSAHNAPDPVKAITVQLPNKWAHEIIHRCNAYPALTARVKELERDALRWQTARNHMCEAEWRDMASRCTTGLALDRYVDVKIAALNKEPTT